MNSINGYDIRQLRLIQKKVNLFESDEISLQSFITDLTGISNALETIMESWKNELRDEINNLDMIYCSILDGSISKWEGDYKEDERNAVMKIKNLTSSLLEEYLSRFSPEIVVTAISENVENFPWLICPKCYEAWELDSYKAMVICPKCESVLNNPESMPEFKRQLNNFYPTRG